MYEIENLRDLFICGDAIQEMQKIPDRSIDLIIISPPYNLKNSAGNGLKNGNSGKWANATLINGYSNYNDDMPNEDYIKWQRNCLNEMMRLLKDDGAIFYNHKWRVQKGLLQDRREIIEGFPLRQIIIWKRKVSTNAKIILDPFMGSGTTAIVAKKLNRNFIGIEISPKYCEMSKKRLACALQNIQRELLLPL